LLIKELKKKFIYETYLELTKKLYVSIRNNVHETEPLFRS
jgi:hypothetical protein